MWELVITSWCLLTCRSSDDVSTNHTMKKVGYLDKIDKERFLRELLHVDWKFEPKDYINKICNDWKQLFYVHWMNMHQRSNVVFVKLASHGWTRRLDIWWKDEIGWDALQRRHTVKLSGKDIKDWGIRWPHAYVKPSNSTSKHWWPLTLKPSRVWKQVNSILRPNKSCPSQLIEDAANKFSDYFSIVTIGSSINYLPPPTIPQLDHTYQFYPFTIDEVFSALSQLDTRKATGTDEISAKTLKLASSAVAPSICAIFNHNLATSSIPYERKSAKVVPIPKATSKSRDICDYRPISILPVVSKVYESLVCQQVTSFLAEQVILNGSQSGFRSNHCSQDVLLRVVEDWRYSLDENNIVGAVFVDLRKAFNWFYQPSMFVAKTWSVWLSAWCFEVVFWLFEWTKTEGCFWWQFFWMGWGYSWSSPRIIYSGTPSV